MTCDDPIKNVFIVVNYWYCDQVYFLFLFVNYKHFLTHLIVDGNDELIVDCINLNYNHQLVLVELPSIINL